MLLDLIIITVGLEKIESKYNEVLSEAFTGQANIFAFKMESVTLGSK